jgi:hypothetical protein
MFFSLLADDTMVIARIENVFVCLRFNDDELIIHENFLGPFSTPSQTAESVHNILKSVLSSLKLDLKV